VTAIVMQGDARALQLPDASVDLVVTSPPYFGQRSYTDGGEHYDGQIGAEPTPAAYIDALIGCTREWMRVLKPTGSIWVNLGDKYDSGTSTWRANSGDRLGDGRQVSSWNTGSQRVTVGRPKSLLGLPWRYALACVDDLGLTLRAEVIWSKPNGLPESVTDRVRRSHEQWFHFTAGPAYFAGIDALREPYGTNTHGGTGASNGTKARRADASGRVNGHQGMADVRPAPNPLGKLPGSVWEIPTQPLVVPAELEVDHFAAFPTEWPRRIIQGWSPTGICVECGEGRRPVVYKATLGHSASYDRTRSTVNPHKWLAMKAADPDRITGYACGCVEPTAPTRPAVVLDPFGGTGTTALVAAALGRIGITVDRSADYCRIARWRTTDPAQIAKALGVDKPPTQLPGQRTLFDLAPNYDEGGSAHGNL